MATKRFGSVRMVHQSPFASWNCLLRNETAASERPRSNLLFMLIAFPYRLACAGFLVRVALFLLTRILIRRAPLVRVVQATAGGGAGEAGAVQQVREKAVILELPRPSSFNTIGKARPCASSWLCSCGTPPSNTTGLTRTTGSDSAPRPEGSRRAERQRGSGHIWDRSGPMPMAKPIPPPRGAAFCEQCAASAPVVVSREIPV